MADIDGQWESVAQSPIGEQRSTLTLVSQDGGFAGSGTGPGGNAEIVDGTVTGDQVAFKMKVAAPFPMTVTVTGTLADGVIEGTLDTGAFGKFPVKITKSA